MRLALEGLALSAVGRVLVEGVDLSLAAGRTLALVGPSGGGKSLSALAMLGLLPAGVTQVAGRVLRDGAEVDPADLRGRAVGLVQQSPGLCLNPIVTVGTHFRETLRRRDWREDAVRRLAEVGLDDAGLLRAYPFQLSGGMAQRVVIALALALDPPFLIADEPTTDLDLVVQGQILDLLDGLRRRRGLGLLLVTHDFSVVARMADEVAVLAGGTIVERQPVRELFFRPRDARTRALLMVHRRLTGSGPR